jgi:hypothetical protein
MRQDTTLTNAGTVGNSQGANTAVATIATPGVGRYRIWGHCRHSLADGLKISSPISLVLAGGAGDTISFGPLVVDITSAATSIGIQLNTATGASDTAAATIYAEKINH